MWQIERLFEEFEERFRLALELDRRMTNRVNRWPGVSRFVGAGLGKRRAASCPRALENLWGLEYRYE